VKDAKEQSPQNDDHWGVRKREQLFTQTAHIEEGLLVEALLPEFAGWNLFGLVSSME
jgi:hypothetical protein